MIDLIVKGGVFMYPIIFCSIVALAVFIERLWVLRRKNIIPGKFVRRVEDLVRNEKIPEAIFLAKADPSAIGKIYSAGLRNLGKGMWLVKEAIVERGDREAIALEKRIGILATIANLSPLLGLLGTVSGMIKSFSAIPLGGAENTIGLAGGIGEALISTAAGLCVAIPSLVCHRILKDKAESLIFDMEESALRFIEIMQMQSEKN